MNTTATEDRTAIAIDIDQPFQRVLAAWLDRRSYRVVFTPLAQGVDIARHVDLVVCGLAEPKHSGAQTQRQLARSHPGIPLIALSPRFAADTRSEALAQQLGAQAALAMPCSRYDFDTALDAALIMPSTTLRHHADPHASLRMRHRR